MSDVFWRPSKLLGLHRIGPGGELSSLVSVALLPLQCGPCFQQRMVRGIACSSSRKLLTCCPDIAPLQLHHGTFHPQRGAPARCGAFHIGIARAHRPTACDPKLCLLRVEVAAADATTPEHGQGAWLAIQTRSRPWDWSQISDPGGPSTWAGSRSQPQVGLGQTTVALRLQTLTYHYWTGVAELARHPPRVVTRCQSQQLAGAIQNASHKLAGARSMWQTWCTNGPVSGVDISHLGKQGIHTWGSVRCRCQTARWLCQSRPAVLPWQPTPEAHTVIYSRLAPVHEPGSTASLDPTEKKFHQRIGHKNERAASWPKAAQGCTPRCSGWST